MSLKFWYVVNNFLKNELNDNNSNRDSDANSQRWIVFSEIGQAELLKRCWLVNVNWALSKTPSLGYDRIVEKHDLGVTIRTNINIAGSVLWSSNIDQRKTNERKHRCENNKQCLKDPPDESRAGSKMNILPNNRSWLNNTVFNFWKSISNQQILRHTWLASTTHCRSMLASTVCWYVLHQLISMVDALKAHKIHKGWCLIVTAL